MVVYHKVKVTKLYDTKVIQCKIIQQGYTTRLYNTKVTQLSSYHLTNKEVLYLHTAESQDNILPRGGPIQNPVPPLLEVLSPHYKVIQ